MNTTIIILIIYAFIHVFTWVTKEMAKKKERERHMEEEMNRRIAEGRLQAPEAPARVDDPLFSPAPPRAGGPTVMSSQSGPVSVRAGRPVDDAAARRKAQLEKLRTGRATGRPAQLPTRGTSIPSETMPTAPAEMSGADQQRRTAAEEKFRSERRKQVQKQRDAAARATRREILASSETVAGAPLAVASTSAIQHVQSTSEKRRGPNLLRQRLSSQQSLRDLFILKELIDRPVSMR